MSARPNSTNTVWSLRKDFKDFVEPLGEEIALCVDFQYIVMDRPTARLLARRINRCLDETAKR